MKEYATPCLSTSSTTDEIETTASSSYAFPSSTNSFKKSQAPSRILFIQNNTWLDFDDQVFDELRNGFVAGKPVQEISINGKSYVFDFIRMVQIDLLTGTENSVAWIDVNGQCFFPRMVVGSESVRPEAGFGCEYSDETIPRFSGAEMLGDDDRFYKVVEKLFLNGMRKVASDTRVTKVYKCTYSCDLEKLRLKTFQMMMEMTKTIRGGDANVRFGWFGASVEEVASIVKHGFGRTNDGVLGGESHGVGVHLSPPHFPSRSSLLSEEDESKEKHIVLCRVIMGNSEKIEAGSLQCHPGTGEFDSGVDNLTNPKWYIVWGTHMNTHILPEYIVTFKSSSSTKQQATNLVKGISGNSARRPLVAAGLSFQKLLLEMGRYLPNSKMQTLEMLYNKQKAGKLSKDVFIGYLRSMAGDKLLATSIRKIRGY